jgi:serine phosphatase RsbU (regulator of sigma subunit)
VTAFVGVLSAVEGRLRYLSAAQGPILHIGGADGVIRELASQGVPLGIAPDFPYDPPSEVVLAPGDCLALFTDGFFEWPNRAGERLGCERFRNLLHSHRRKPAAELIQSVYHDVRTFAAEAPQRDDLTAVVIRKL